MSSKRKKGNSNFINNPHTCAWRTGNQFVELLTHLGTPVCVYYAHGNKLVSKNKTITKKPSSLILQQNCHTPILLKCCFLFILEIDSMAVTRLILFQHTLSACGQRACREDAHTNSQSPWECSLSCAHRLPNSSGNQEKFRGRTAEGNLEREAGVFLMQTGEGIQAEAELEQKREIAWRDRDLLGIMQT